MKKLVIVGGGRMGAALLTGLLGAGWAASDELAIVEPVEARRAELEAQFSGVTMTPTTVEAAGAVLAVKPVDVPAACAAVAGAQIPRVLSIAAGITLGALEADLGAQTAVVRAMPNTPALIGAGVAAIAGGRSAREADLAWAEQILGAVGTVVRVKEPLLDAVTGLSGSGPAYVFLLAEALIDAGVLVGLPHEISAALAVQTLLGASRLLAESGDSPATLRAAVTSPGGTTAAGLRVLEDGGVRAAVLAAVDAATTRSRELGA